MAFSKEHLCLLPPHRQPLLFPPIGEPLRKDAPQSEWPAVVFWADLLADSCSLLTDCVRTGRPASQVRDPNIPSRWSQDPEAPAIFRAVMGTAPAEDYMQDGHLLIMEFVLPPLGSHADLQVEGRLMSDLNMLAVTGGKERSEREWKALLDAAGFSLHEARSTAGDSVMVENVAILAAEPV